MRVRSVDREPRRGTTFSIFFPSPAAKVVSIHSQAPKEEPRPETQRAA
jgi:hypothetical protein